MLKIKQNLLRYNANPYRENLNPLADLVVTYIPLPAAFKSAFCKSPLFAVFGISALNSLTPQSETARF